MNRKPNATPTFALSGAVLSLVAMLSAADLQFEAEDWSGPQSAWAEDQHSANRWNLWSKDKDADKKWSGMAISFVKVGCLWL